VIDATRNDGFAYRDVVGGGDAGTSALAYLVRRHRHSSERTWRERMERGEVRIGDVPAAPDDVLRAGDSLVWRRPPWLEPAVPLRFDVLHRDDDLLVVGKPSGLPVVPNGGFLRHTLLALVRRDVPDAVPMHRLGRGTSGVVLFALTAEARRTVAATWRAGGVERVYRGLVAGAPRWDAVDVEVPIGPVPHARLGSVHAAAATGKPARSRVVVVERRTDRAVVEVRIETGRPHQIRIHLAAAGHPLAGDPLYVAGGVPSSDAALPGDGGYLLHAHRLTLPHPRTGRRVAFEAPLPAELAAFAPSAA
jgi:23S rRNA pseudouridine1911/1915/1917 synthase